LGFAGITGVVRGNVRSASGGPVSQAEVIIEEMKTKTMTTTSGFFVFLCVNPGLYTLRVCKEGEGQAVVHNVLVHADLSARVTVVLSGTSIGVFSYSEPLRLEPGRIFLLSGQRVRSMPLQDPAQTIRTIPSRVEIDHSF